MKHHRIFITVLSFTLVFVFMTLALAATCTNHKLAVDGSGLMYARQLRVTDEGHVMGYFYLMSCTECGYTTYEYANSSAFPDYIVQHDCSELVADLGHIGTGPHMYRYQCHLANCTYSTIREGTCPPSCTNYINKRPVDAQTE